MPNTYSEDAVSLFVAECRAVDEDIAMAVFHFLKQWRPKHTFRASDDLSRVYGIVDDDLDDAVLELARETGYRRPLSGKLGVKPVRSASDLAELLHHLRHRQEQEM